MIVILPHSLFLLELSLMVDIIPEEMVGSTDSCKCLLFLWRRSTSLKSEQFVSCAPEMQQTGTPNLPREEELRSKLDFIRMAKALK